MDALTCVGSDSNSSSEISMRWGTGTGGRTYSDVRCSAGWGRQVGLEVSMRWGAGTGRGAHSEMRHGAGWGKQAGLEVSMQQGAGTEGGACSETSSLAQMANNTGSGSGMRWGTGTHLSRNSEKKRTCWAQLGCRLSADFPLEVAASIAVWMHPELGSSVAEGGGPEDIWDPRGHRKAWDVLLGVAGHSQKCNLRSQA